MAAKLLWATGPLSMSHICAFDHLEQIYFNAGVMDLIPVAFDSNWKGYLGTTQCSSLQYALKNYVLNNSSLANMR